MEKEFWAPSVRPKEEITMAQLRAFLLKGESIREIPHKNIVTIKAATESRIEEIRTFLSRSGILPSEPGAN